MNTHVAMAIVTTVVVSSCAGSAEVVDCTPNAPAAYAIEIPVGEMRLPGRVDLVCLDGNRTWGRFLVVLGRDTLTGAIMAEARSIDTLRFASGGAIVAVTLVTDAADSVQGALHLAGARAFEFQGARLTGGPPALIREHAQLVPVEPGIVSTDSGESYPIVLADGGLMFTRHGADLGRQTLMTAPTGGPARSLLEPPAGVTDRSPSLSPDGGVLLFASNRDPTGATGARKATAIWFMRATADGWSEARPVSWPSDDQPASPAQPMLAADGTLYFVDDREDGLGGRDAFQARWADGVVSDVARMPSPISTAADEAGLVLSRDGRTLIVARSRGPGHQGGDDLYFHVRSGESWSEPVNLGLPVNTFANEYGPWLEADGTRLWFTSDRFGSGDVFTVELTRDAHGALIGGPAASR